MKTIEMNDKIDYICGKSKIKSLTINPIGFVKYVELTNLANIGSSDEKEVARKFFRARIKAQVEAKDETGAIVKLDDAAISYMPIQYAVLMKENLSRVLITGEKEPSISVEGNGVTSPVVIRLGEPVKFSDGKTIEELEFRAETLGDLEDGLICDTALDQTVFLLGIAKPYGQDVNLMALPSWAIDSIGLMDGVFIMKNVAELFFGMPTDS